MSKHSKSRQKRALLEVKNTTKGIEFLEKNYASKFLQQLNTHRKSEEFCDITLVVGDARFPAHKLVLMSASPYFQAMFSSHMQEQSRTEVPLLGLESRAVQLIVDFLYSGSLQASQCDVQDLLLASDLLQVAAVRQMCVDYLSGHTDVNNCLGVLQLGEQFSCPELVEKAMTVLTQRFSAVFLAERESFVAVSAGTFLKITQSDQLVLDTGARSEMLLVEAALAWLERDPEGRLETTKQVLADIRWTSVSPDSLEPLLKQGALADKEELREEIFTLRKNSQDKPARMFDKSVVVIGGYLQSRTGPVCPRHNTCELYHLATQQWREFPGLPIDSPSFVFSLKLNGRLLCVALTYSEGENGKLQAEHLLGYDLATEDWIAADCTGKASLFNLIYNTIKLKGSVTYDANSQKLYTVSHEAIHSIHLTESPDNQQLNVSSIHRLPMLEAYGSSRRQDMRTVVCGGHLYCVGGSVTESQTESFPQCDVYMLTGEEGGEWQQKASMIYPRACLALVELAGCLYAVGGFYEYRQVSVERYEPHTDSWTLRPNMAKPRSHHTCVTAAGEIYALGGKSYSYKQGGARKVLNLCEVYDPDADTWSEMAPMSQARCLAAAAVL